MHDRESTEGRAFKFGDWVVFDPSSVVTVWTFEFWVRPMGQYDCVIAGSGGERVLARSERLHKLEVVE